MQAILKLTKVAVDKQKKKENDKKIKKEKGIKKNKKAPSVVQAPSKKKEKVGAEAPLGVGA
jgi:hypothetical protein